MRIFRKRSTTPIKSLSGAMWNLSSDTSICPEFLPPEGMDAKSYLRMLCDRGIAERYAEVTPELRQRLEYEIQTIEDMGYVEYFLIVWDFINYAKQHNIAVGPARLRGGVS